MSCTEQKVDICPEEPQDALLKQRQDRKWQGTLLRVATLLLLLSCTSLALLSCRTAFGRSSQQNEPGQSLQNMHIRLIANSENCSHDYKYLEWNLLFNSSLTFENSSIIVPETRVYFVYTRFILICNEENTDFRITLEKWNEAYAKLEKVTKADWSLTCSSTHTVFIGELFELIKGDQLRVKVEEGCDLIHESTFGAFSQ